MGSIIGWRCEDCGAGESLYCGGGMGWIDEPAVAEGSSEGAFGHAMERLFGDGIPKGWSVFRVNEHYLCPNCGGVIRGGGFRIDDGSGAGWLDFHLEPDACEACGCALAFWDDRMPLSERELARHCEDIAKNGCPKCGGKNVSVEFGNWD